jgi:hypothetical protein
MAHVRILRPPDTARWLGHRELHAASPLPSDGLQPARAMEEYCPSCQSQRGREPPFVQRRGRRVRRDARPVEQKFHPSLLRSNILRINHYFTKSHQDLEERLQYAIEIGGPSRPDTRRVVAQTIEASTVYDDTIHRFLPQLRVALAAGSMLKVPPPSELPPASFHGRTCPSAL